MAISTATLSEAFLTQTQENQLSEYRTYDLITNAYVKPSTYMWFRGSTYSVPNNESGYLYGRVGFAMSENPWLIDPVSFKTPIPDGNGGFMATLTFVMPGPGGRAMRNDMYGPSYLAVWEQLIQQYIMFVQPF